NWLARVPVSEDWWVGGAVDDVAVDAGGDAVAIVANYGLSRGSTIEAISWTRDGPPGPPEPLSSPESQNAWTGRVAMDARGNAVALWNEVTSSGILTLRAAVKPAGSNWQPPQELSGGERGDRPQLAITPDGEAVAAWFQSSTDVTVRAAVLEPGSMRFDAPRDMSAPGP